MHTLINSSLSTQTAIMAKLAHSTNFMHEWDEFKFWVQMPSKSSILSYVAINGTTSLETNLLEIKYIMFGKTIGTIPGFINSLY